MGLFNQKYACHFQPFKSEIFFSIFIIYISVCDSYNRHPFSSEQDHRQTKKVCCHRLIRIPAFRDMHSRFYPSFFLCNMQPHLHQQT